MRSLKLALREIGNHWFRTIMTVLLFSFSLGAIACSLCLTNVNAEGVYMQVLAENNINSVRITLDNENATLSGLKKMFPNGQRFFQFSRNYFHVYDVTDADLPSLGFSLAEGRCPTADGEIAYSLLQYEELKRTGILRNTFNMDRLHFYFTTFEEAQILLQMDSYEGKPLIMPQNLVGVIDTAYDADYVADLRQKAENATEKESKDAFEQEISYYMCSGAHTCDFMTNNGGKPTENVFLTALPKKDAELRVVLSGFKQFCMRNALWQIITTDAAEYTIAEMHYEDYFAQPCRFSAQMQVFVIPFAVLFAVISFIMMTLLEISYSKAARNEIATFRAMGMTQKGVFGVGLLRCVIVALLSFGVSIGTLYLSVEFFKSGGYLEQILLGFGLSRHRTDVWHLAFRGAVFPSLIFPFFYCLAIALLSSIAGYRRYGKKMPAEIYRMDGDES